MNSIESISKYKTFSCKFMFKMMKVSLFFLSLDLMCKQVVLSVFERYKFTENISETLVLLLCVEKIFVLRTVD